MDQVPVLGIEEIVFEVEDLERSIAFYQDVIGLRLHSRGLEEAWFRAGEQWLAIFQKGRAGGEPFALRIAEEDRERDRQQIEPQGFQTGDAGLLRRLVRLRLRPRRSQNRTARQARVDPRP